jgi:hypothetical protein
VRHPKSGETVNGAGRRFNPVPRRCPAIRHGGGASRGDLRHARFSPKAQDPGRYLATKR